ITYETLMRNLEFAGVNGAEVSPLHYHAMPDVANIRGVDVILAGSYGDSVGRAEFSGRKVTNLKPIVPLVLDQFGVVNKELMRRARSEFKEDVSLAARCVDSRASLRLREICPEQHYLRRML